MTQEDGGPAFPCSKPVFEDGSLMGRMECYGMSLRDYFAGVALPVAIENGWETIARNPAMLEESRTESGRRKCLLKMAEMAYAMADAMLAAREAGKAVPHE